MGALAAALICGTVFVLISAVRSRGTAADSPHSLSAGTLFVLPAGDKRTKSLEGSGFTETWLLATRGQRRFFRLDTSSGRSCFGTGRVGTSWPLGSIACTHGRFPSAEVPLLDESTVGMNRGDENMALLDVNGFASDAIDRIALRDPQGVTVMEIPVTDNVYTADTMPDVDVVSLAALNSEGTVIYTVPGGSK